MTLAEKILSLRTRSGLSQEELAERLGVSRQSVSKWETGQSTPDLEKIIRLADLFGVTVDELVREGARPHPPEPRTIYVERRGTPLTGIRKAGVVLAASGAILALVGLAGAGVLILLAPVLILLALPLLLAKKHPFLISGWLLLAVSLLFLNPYSSVFPWGLAGGLRYLYALLIRPEMRYSTYYLAALLGVLRGLSALALLFLTWRAWKRRT